MRHEALDSWRGICASMVVLYHFAIASHVYTVDIVRNAFLFVDFFFVLSGFVIASNYQDRLLSGFGVGKFMLLRFGRVWPLHAFILVLYILLEMVLMSSDPLQEAVGRTAFGDEKHGFMAILTNLTLTHSLPGVHEDVTWNGPSWSISVEFYTYLIFAVGLWIAARLPKSRLWVIAGIVAIMIAAPVIIYMLGGRKNIFLTTGGGLIRCLFGFAAGVASAMLYTHFRAPLTRLFARRAWATAAELAVVVAVIVYASLIGFSSWNLTAPFLFILAILVFAPQAGAVSSLLTTRPFLYLGALSYSIYMTHYIIQNLLYWAYDWVKARGGGEIFDRLPGYETPDALVPTERLLTGDLYVIGISVLVLLASSFTYHFVEKPGRDLFRRLASPRGRAAPVAQQAE